MTRLLSVLLSGALALAPLTAPPGDPGGADGEAWQSGRKAGVTLRNSQIILRGNGLGGARSDGYQLKRPCWYEPGPDAGSMLDTQEDLFARWKQANPDGTEEEFQEFLRQFRERVGQDGRWWVPAYNEDDPDGLSCWGALDPFVWVPPGETPPAGITLQELADIARAALTVPEPRIELNPDAKSYVNLPTWVWLAGIGEPTRSVTATIPGIMSVTVTATLEDIQIDPGTTADRAEVKEDCGATGHPYRRGGQFTCGVRYLRASVDQPRDVYVLTVTTVWPIEVEDDIVPFAYDPVEVGVTRDVPVGEVQTTVRRSE
ncbi:enoyl reductase [Thermocatellispora tengchongensis]|uniref:Enoyl reductase n=1 Tax=Thermocatellispora tengchongensis TaxID=1073253 RepID=A0A840P7Y9_9ACTN|nr:hypothetical protein [Thermocatellispora tengchongensis]MBB5134716.1 enoyl reductase [Thermocatellispora tengchongensis]